MAEKYYSQGKTEAALREYQKILELKADDPEIRRIMGDLLRRLNRNDEAIAQYLWIGDHYLGEGFYTKAIAMYKLITRLVPDNENVPLKLADLYTKQGLIIEARQIYLELAEEYKRSNNPKKALGIYKKILEFDRNNVKMRLLLAENYFREKMFDEAVSEYLILSDILIKKKEFKQAEDILHETHSKTKNIRLFEKLIQCYIAQGNEAKAIQMLSNLGEELFRHVGLLKILGELYFRNNQIDAAEKIYSRIAEIDSSETEIILKLGKVYLQREEYDNAFRLFAPTIEKFMEEKKYDEASSLLRIIITSNNTYLPALNKLATIFKLSGKTSSLIALYESFLPIYEQQGEREALIAVLKELISISESPYAYQEQLAKLTSQSQDEIDDDKKQHEFIDFQLRNVDLAIKEKNFKKAIDLLLTAQSAFPKNLDIRLKLFDTYQMINDTDALVHEGIELLQLYKDLKMEPEYKSLLEKLTILKPNEERLLELIGHDKTNIEIDFDREELIEQMQELQHPEIEEMELPQGKSEEEDVLVLGGEDSVPDVQTKTDRKLQKGLSTQLVEVDFYISEGYFDDAENVLERLKAEYPESKEVIARLERMKKFKKTQPKPTPQPAVKRIDTGEIHIEPSISRESDILQQYEDSKVDVAVDRFAEPNELKIETDRFSGVEDVHIEIDMEERAKEEPVVPMVIDKEQIIQAPSTKTRPESSETDYLGSSADFLNIDDILMQEEPTAASESPFKDIGGQELSGEEELIRDEDLLLEQINYYQVENLVEGEALAIQFWMKEIEKQRSSTIEKNMMEIFKEFRKGVDEKIGHEDYDTRYNLGIAYKEMGLLEEAIHEFLISSKHPLKFFDSAGLLGICFREKGMLEESMSWFERALEFPDRKREEYMAVKYELMLSAKLKEDYEYAKKLLGEIMKENSTYRNVKELYEEIKSK